MKNLFKEAHKMTREMKEKYPEIDYQAQFGLNLSYLLEKEEEEEMKELKGSEKQIKWANDIREKMIKDFNYYKEENVYSLKEYYETLFPLNTDISEKEIVEAFEDIINSQENAVWFVDNRGRNPVELVVEEQNIRYVKNINLDINIFKGAKEMADLNKLARKHMKALDEDEKDVFRKTYRSLDSTAKEIIIELVK